jgi:hypothetical protein
MSAARWHPFDIVACVLAERLRGFEPSPGLRAALAAPSVDWEGVVGQASGQYVLAAFAAALRDLGLADVLEPGLREFLAAVHAANVERNGKLRDQLAEIAAALNRIDIEPVLLKGAIRLVDGLYPGIGWRMMRDLDLLVPGARLADGIGALRGIGYVTERWDGRDFLVRHPRRRVVVEVHRELFGSRRQRRLLRAAEMIRDSGPTTLENATIRLPSTAHQALHLIAHSQISDGGYTYGRIDLRDRLEAAQLACRSPQSLAGEEVFARFAAAGYRRPLISFLLALHDCALCAIPVGARIDGLTAFQQRRIALQARSAAMTAAAWYVLQFEKQVMTEEGRPRIVQTLRSAFGEPEARRALVEKLLRGPPLQ